MVDCLGRTDAIEANAGAGHLRVDELELAGGDFRGAVEHGLVGCRSARRHGSHRRLAVVINPEVRGDVPIGPID